MWLEVGECCQCASRRIAGQDAGVKFRNLEQIHEFAAVVCGDHCIARHRHPVTGGKVLVLDEEELVGHGRCAPQERVGGDASLPLSGTEGVAHRLRKERCPPRESLDPFSFSHRCQNRIVWAQLVRQAGGHRRERSCIVQLVAARDGLVSLDSGWRRHQSERHDCGEHPVGASYPPANSVEGSREEADRGVQPSRGAEHQWGHQWSTEAGIVSAGVRDDREEECAPHRSTPTQQEDVSTNDTAPEVAKRTQDDGRTPHDDDDRRRPVGKQTLEQSAGASVVEAGWIRDIALTGGKQDNQPVQDEEDKDQPDRQERREEAGQTKPPGSHETQGRRTQGNRDGKNTGADMRKGGEHQAHTPKRPPDPLDARTGTGADKRGHAECHEHERARLQQAPEGE